MLPLVRLAALSAFELRAAFDEAELGHKLTLLALAAFSAAWVTALGAAVGSFLNVVIYRLPLGMSLVRPKSRCPACGASIRAGDNVPILGWIRLRGRCRDCGNPISPRYPLIEATTAILFLGLAHFELFSGGANLPSGSDVQTGLTSILWHLRPELIGIYLYHMMLVCSLLCISLIVRDGFPPPKSLLAATFVVGLLVPLVLPSVHPVDAGLSDEWYRRIVLRIGDLHVAMWPTATLESGIGMIVGLVLGMMFAAAVFSEPNARADRRGVVAVVAIIGAYLGWQAVISCCLIAAVLSVVRPLLACCVRLPLTAVVAASVVVQLPLWRMLERAEWWPGSRGWPVLRSIGWPEPGFTYSTLAAAAAIAVLFVTATSWMRSRWWVSLPEMRL